jgi:hypothetical protein
MVLRSHSKYNKLNIGVGYVAISLENKASMLSGYSKLQLTNNQIPLMVDVRIVGTIYLLIPKMSKKLLLNMINKI